MTNLNITILLLAALTAPGVSLIHAATNARSALGPKQLEVFGQKINYIEAGSGANVILLHGLGDDLSVWDQTVSALTPKYHVWVPDQIGFGRSDKPLINYRVSVLVEFLNAFCKKLGIQKATLVGNSLGGWVAAAYALAYPDMVDKLVLVGSAGYWPKHHGVREVPREQLMLLSPTTRAAYAEILTLLFYDKALLTDAFIDEAYAAQLKRNDGYTINRFIESILRREDRLDGKTKQIKAPTLVVWGREDELTPLAIGSAFAKEIPNTQTAFIDKCGHMPQLECAASLNTALLKFLAGAPEQAPAR